MHGDERHFTGLDLFAHSDDGGAAARDPYDQLVHQIFAVSLDLHTALAHNNNPHVAERIRSAIGGLDEAIEQLRDSIAELVPPEDAERVPAVDR